MAQGARRADRPGKSAYAGGRCARRRATRAALGKDRQGLCLRGTVGNAEPGRSVRRPQPVVRQAVYAAAGSDPPMHRLLAGCGSCRRPARASAQQRRHLCCRGACALRRDRNAAPTHGLALSVCFGPGFLQGRLREFCAGGIGGNRRTSGVLQERCGKDFPHLFQPRPRRRSVPGHLSLFRRDAEGAQ